MNAVQVQEPVCIALRLIDMVWQGVLPGMPITVGGVQTTTTPTLTIPGRKPLTAEEQDQVGWALYSFADVVANTHKGGKDSLCGEHQRYGDGWSTCQNI